MRWVRWLVLFTLGVFIACIATGFAVIWLHGGTPEPFVIVAVAFCTALLFLLRVHVLNVLPRRREIRAVKALIDAMARLSDGDLSVYRSILKKEEGETSSILTSEGSPNHQVLEQMARLDFAALEETRTSGTPPHALTTVRYSLTPVGHLNLGKFWKWILARHFRLHQEGVLGPH